MDHDHLVKFLDRIGCTKIGRNGPHWVRAHCPLAPWTHKSRADRKPSFSVMVAADQPSMCRCHACGFKGTLLMLVRRWAKLSGEGDTALYDVLYDSAVRYDVPSLAVLKARAEKLAVVKPPAQEVAGIVVPTWLAEDPGGEVPDLPALPENLLDPLRELSPEARAWLHARGLTDKTLATWEVGWLEAKRRIALPIRDLKGRLVGISGRSIDAWETPKFVHATGFRKDFYLYGEHLMVKGSLGYLVEGFFDAMMLWQRGYRSPLAFMGSSLGKVQAEKVVSNCESVVVVRDGDEPGKEIAVRVVTTLGTRITTRVPEIPEGKDPDDLTLDECYDLLGPPRLPA